MLTGSLLTGSLLSGSLLSVYNISKSYPGVQALEDVSIALKPGEVHALVGENGAGKSTLVKIISGAEQPDSGEIRFNDVVYPHLNPHLSRKLGIEVIYQEFNLIPSLSVAENVFFGGREGRTPFVNYEKLISDTNSLFASMNVQIDPSKKVEDVSVAYMQLVEIAKAISKEARFLIMDEPTAPLTISEVDILFSLVRKLKERGVTILYISHRLEEIFTIADRVTVMRDGKIISTDRVADTDRKQLIRHMVGRTLNETFPRRNTQPGELVFEAEHLSGNGVQDINFKVLAGEIVGLGGLVGAGRTELARIIFGADKVDQGVILLNGRPVSIPSPHEGVANGIGMVPEDRKNDGVLLELSIRENAVLPVIRKLSKAGFINRKRERETVGRLVRQLNIKTPIS